jgi:hypothetical protein
MGITNQKGWAILLQTISLIIIIAFFFAIIIHSGKDEKNTQQSNRPLNLEPYNPNQSK